MTAFFRYREYGSPDWTEVCAEGELEHLAADVLRPVLEAAESLHAQERVDEEWEDL